MLTHAELLSKVEAHLTETGMAASRFGLEALGDPNFVRNLRAGREPRSRVIAKVIAFIEERPAGSSGKPRSDHGTAGSRQAASLTPEPRATDRLACCLAQPIIVFLSVLAWAPVAWAGRAVLKAVGH